MNKLRALRYFLKVAETSSFSMAASFFNVPVSSVSRRIRDLESELKVDLLHRSTRVVKLTELGEIYYDQVSKTLIELDDIDAFISHGSQTPTGNLKISVMPGFARMVIYPLLDAFHAQFPDIILDLELTNQLADVTQNEVDIAIRATAELPERVVAKRLCDNEFILVAAPEYLEQFGTPQSLDDLEHHTSLLYRGPNGPRMWQAETKTGWRTVTSSPTAISNDGIWLLEATQKGRGLCLLPRWGVQASLRNGSLIELPLQDARLCVGREPNRGIYLLYLRPRYKLAKIRVAIDFFVQEIAKIHDVQS
jgi:DNA-binding transcriptional LysR family regulator